MAVNQPDRSLRLTVARLAKYGDADVRAILDRLDESEKSRILALLAELDGDAAPGADQSAEPAFDDVVIPERISPWLAARINGRVDSGEETADPFSLTQHAQSALRRCAAAMADVPVTLPKPASLLDRLWARRT
jgi:hypothetical protein